MRCGQWYCRQVVLGVPRPQDDLYDPQIYKDPLLISIPKASEVQFMLYYTWDIELVELIPKVLFSLTD